MAEKAKILIIDDDANACKLESDLLELAGYEVKTVGTMEPGIALAKEYLPDLIIMDLRLPDLNGEDAIKIIKQDEMIKNIPCLIQTASVSKKVLEIIVEEGFAGYITKPIDTRYFAEKIKTYINP